MSVAYIRTFVNIHRIAMDESAPEYNRMFAMLFRNIFKVNFNLKQDAITSIFKDASDTMLLTYFHRIAQLIDNTLDPVQSKPDYDELSEMMDAIQAAITSKNDPTWTRDRILDIFKGQE